MKSKIGLCLYLSVIILFYTKCTGEREYGNTNIDINNKDDNNLNLNVSILLDLSDRISPTTHPNPAMEYYYRDIEYVMSVVKAFTRNCLTKKVIRVQDRIQVYFDPPPQDSSINNLANNLKVALTKDNISLEKVSKIDSTFNTVLRKIYEITIQANHYIGSDIWKFFQTNIKEFCIRDNYKNVVVILTDGYMYHVNSRRIDGNRTSYLLNRDIVSKSLTNADWKTKIDELNYGFIPATNNLNNIHILVLGVNPKPNNPYEEDVIRYYWSKWFNEMGVHSFEIKTAQLPSDLDEVIQEFILRKY